MVGWIVSLAELSSAFDIPVNLKRLCNGKNHRPSLNLPCVLENYRLRIHSKHPLGCFLKQVVFILILIAVAWMIKLIFSLSSSRNNFAFPSRYIPEHNNTYAKWNDMVNTRSFLAFDLFTPIKRNSKLFHCLLVVASLLIFVLYGFRDGFFGNLKLISKFSLRQVSQPGGHSETRGKYFENWYR